MMRMVLWGVAATFGAVSLAAAQGNPVAIAVLPFEDRGSYGQDKEVFRALELGIPAVLASELKNHPGVRLADRARLGRALKSENLGADARVDATTAARVGGESGARYAVTGNFADFYGKFRIDARLVEVGSGRILKVVSNSDPNLQDRAELSRIIQDLAGKVLAAASLQQEGATSGVQARLVPTDALTQYSLGLLRESEGNKTKAGEHYQRALSAFPNYPDAREAMHRIR